MSERMNEIEARWRATTPGPWMCWDGWGDSPTMHAVRIGPAGTHRGLWASGGHDICGTRADLEAVARAPADVAWLVAEVKRLRAGTTQEGTQP